MLACNAALAILYWYVTRPRLREVSTGLADAVSRVEACERTCADACGAALAACEASTRYDDEVTFDAPRAVSVVGYGQTRSPRSRWVYRDVRLSSGEVRREFLTRFPVEGAGGKHPPVEAVHTPESDVADVALKD